MSKRNHWEKDRARAEIWYHEHAEDLEFLCRVKDVDVGLNSNNNIKLIVTFEKNDNIDETIIKHMPKTVQQFFNGIDDNKVISAIKSTVPEQLHIIRKLGTRYAQGYSYNKEPYERWLINRIDFQKWMNSARNKIGLEDLIIYN